MDRSKIVALESGQTVDGLTHHIKQTSFDLIAGRHSYRSVEIVHTLAAAKAVGALHGHTSDGVLTDMLLHFEYKHSAVGTVYFQSGIDRGKLIAFALEGHVDHGTDDLCYFSVFVAHVSQLSE